MNIRSLPGYQGVPDAGRGWGEPDGHGQGPRFRLRDWVALAIVAALVCPLVPCLVAGLNATAQRLGSVNAFRVQQLDERLGLRTRPP